MKKLLFVLAIGAFATACNDNTEKSSSTTDTSAVAPTTDTSAMAPMSDTTTKAADTTKVDTATTK